MSYFKIVCDISHLYFLIKIAGNDLNYMKSLVISNPKVHMLTLIYNTNTTTFGA